MKLTNTLAAALILAATPAFATKWVYVITTDTNGVAAYYDADTIQRSGNLVTVWEKLDLARDKTRKEIERKNRSRYDCSARTRTILHITAYYLDGKNESWSFKEYQQEAKPVIPETLGEDILEAVCSVPSR